MTDSVLVELPNLEATRQLAFQFAKCIEPPIVLGLVGTLGTGKTQWMRFLAEALNGDPVDVTSPTYVLLQRYPAKYPIYHFDWYRLESESQVWDLGIDELYEQPVVVVVEWSDKFPACLPPSYVRVELEQTNQDRPQQRNAKIHAIGSRAQGVLNRLKAVHSASDSG